MTTDPMTSPHPEQPVEPETPEDFFRGLGDPEQPVEALDFDAIDRRLTAAYDEVHRLCQPGSAGRWRMTVPVEVDRDSDMLLVRALDDAQALLRAARASVALDGGLRSAAQAYLDAQSEPAYSWVFESQAARQEGRANREVERMDRIARAGIALREALAASPAAPEPPYLCQHESCSEQTVEPAPPPPVVAALAWALAERSQDGPHGSNERRRFRPLARAFLSDLLRDPRRAAAVRDFLAARLTDPSR
jgi:hypothetical protein